MSNEEFKLMIHLIHKFSTTEMDQFTNWKIQSKVSTVYIELSLQPQTGATEGDYIDLTELVE